MNPASGEERDVRLGRRILPHLGVHGRGEHHRRHTRENRGAEQVVGEAGGELRDRVRRRRGNDNEFGALTDGHVPNLCHTLVEVGVHRVAADRLECGPADKAERGLGGYHLHRVPREHERTHDTDSLVGRDPAGDADDDVQARAPATLR